MKKILGVIFLAVLLIFSAGCISTDDELVGTWKHTLEDEDDWSYVLVFNNDNTGSIDYNQINTNTRSILWEPIEGSALFGDNAYWVNELYLCIFNEDGTMTSATGRVCTLEEGGEKFGGVWTETTGSAKRTYVFNEDGTGLFADSDGDAAFIWEEYGDNQITFQFTRPYFYDENGIFSTTSDKEYALVNGVWTEQNPDDEDVTTYQFYENGLAVRMSTVIETGEVESESWYWYKDHADGTGGNFIYGYSYLVQIQENGTLLSEFDEVFVRVTS